MIKSSKLDKLSQDLKFKEDYDKGLQILKNNRKRMEEFKSLKEMERFKKKSYK